MQRTREQPPMTPEDIDGDLEWEVEKIVKSEIISYQRRVRRSTRTFEELRYSVKWKGSSEDENTWEPPEYLEHGKELVEEFHRENPDMRKLGYVVLLGKRFSCRGQVNAKGFLPYLVEY